MKIIYIHQYFNTPSMSGGTRSYDIATRLIKRGYEVELISGVTPDFDVDKRNKIENIDGIKVHWLDVEYTNYYSFNKRLLSFLIFAFRCYMEGNKMTKPDIIFATSTPLTVALPAVMLAKRFNVPFIFEVRDLWPLVPIKLGILKNPVVKAMALWLEKYAYRNASMIIALSPPMAEYIEKTGIPGNKIEVIPNFSVLERFSPVKDASMLIRKMYPDLPAGYVILYAGTIGYVNGLNYLVEVASKVIRKDESIHFLVVGDGKERKAVMDFAQQTGVLNKNFHIKPPCPKEKVPLLFSAADISTSIFINNEVLTMNSANKFFDSLAAGTPVAINYSGWQADILKRYDAGIVLPPDDTDKAAGIIVNALKDRNWLIKARNNALSLARQFDVEKMVDKLDRILKSVVEDGRKN